MKLWSWIRRRADAPPVAPDAARAVDAELRFHVEAAVEECLARGMSRADAEREVRERFGDLDGIRRACLAEQPGRLRRVARCGVAAWQDARLGVRLLRRSPGFTAVALVTLAVGIGANTAVFSVVHAVLLRPLPYPDPARLLILWETSPQVPTMSIAYLNYQDWRREVELLEELAIYRRDSFNLTGGGTPERVAAAMVSDNLFRALGVSPSPGRAFTAGEDVPGGDRVVVLEHGFWQRRFGGSAAAVGATLHLDGRPYTVVGVMPRGFRWPSRTDLWVPIGQFAEGPGWLHRGNHPGIFGIARMKAGVSLAEAQAEVDTIAARLEQQYPETNQNSRVVYTSLSEFAVRDIRPVLVLLLAAVGGVLLVGCANLATLWLARAGGRARELAVRSSLGASRSRLVGQLLVEGLVLSLAGGVLGTMLASWGTGAVLAIYPEAVPRSEEISVDGVVLGFALLVSLGTGLLFGIVPAWRASTTDSNEVLKAGGQVGAPARREQRLHRTLVVAEVALALMLLVVSALMTRSVMRLLAVDPGFSPGGLLTMSLSLPEATYEDQERRERFYDALIPRLSAIPGIERVAATSNLPLVDGSQTSYAISGRPLPERPHWPMAEYAHVTADYFGTLGIPLRRGRAFEERDRDARPRVVIVDEAFARQHWPDEDPVGRRIVRGAEDTEENRLTVVGVAGTVRYRGLDLDPPFPQFYYPYGVTQEMTIVARVAGDPATAVAAVRRAVHEVDPDVAVGGARLMTEILGESTAPHRMSTTLLLVFGGLAALIAVVGVYGVMSLTVSRRAHEFGIRLALGAQPGRLFRLVLRQGAVVTAAGLLLGLAGAFASTRLAADLLYGVAATDVPTFMGVTLLLGLAALLACLVPGRRATRVDPVVALRQQ